MELSDANANLLLILHNGSGLHTLCKASFYWKNISSTCHCLAKANHVYMIQSPHAVPNSVSFLILLDALLLKP